MFLTFNEVFCCFVPYTILVHIGCSCLKEDFNLDKNFINFNTWVCTLPCTFWKKCISSFLNTILWCKCSPHFKVQFIFNLKHKSVGATNGSSNHVHFHRICIVISYIIYIALKLQKCTFCLQPTLEVQLSNYIKRNLVKISNINKPLHTDTDGSDSDWWISTE